MRRVSIAAQLQRRQRHWLPNLNSSGTTVATACGISVRSVGGITSASTSTPIFISTSATVGSSSVGTNNHNRHYQQHHRLSMSTSTMASVSCWVKDVLRTKRLSPPNPILESLPSAEGALEGVTELQLELESTTSKSNSGNGETTTSIVSSLPIFSILQPHHLEHASEEIARQHDVELAQLEVRWTSLSEDSDSDSVNDTSLCALLLDLDRLTAPVVQLLEVSNLYETLASPPDKIEDWIAASDSVDSGTTKAFVENLYRSRIVYRALAAAISEKHTTTTAATVTETTTAKATTTTTNPITATATRTSSLLVPFLKRGAHIDSEAEAEGLQQIQEELSILNDRLDNVVSYDRASKAMRLQCMSDMYNCIGLSRLQAESILSFNASGNEDNNDNDKPNHSVWDLARLQHNHMMKSPKTDLTEGLFPEIASSLQSYLPKHSKLNLDGVGAFLEGKSEIGNAINSGNVVDTTKASLKAKYDFKHRVLLHGVMKGLIDFCDQILGIVIVEDTEANSAEAGWNQNVRLLHLYEKEANAEDSNNDNDNNNNNEDDDSTRLRSRGDYLGTIYFDPFADSYWRTEDAKNLVSTTLFSQQATGQTSAPVAVVALKITPIWDDTPVPMIWKDTRDLLHQFGKALQLVLDQSRQRKNYPENDHEAIEAAPIDASDFLAHFLEMWLQNDGFLHRLVQLSQDELVLDDETIKILRTDLKNEKALELTNTMFLSALQFSVFDSFDPRGDETLVALQERLAVQYLPGSNLPDPSDLSPLLAVFQESGLDQKMSAYGTLWSEVLASTVYETFQNTDLRDRNEVTRLGTGIRDLFLRGKPPSRADFADLCKIDEAFIGSGAALKHVYGFGATAESGDNN